MRLNQHATVQSLPRWWSDPAASIPLNQQTFFQLLHITSQVRNPRMVDPLFKDTPDDVVHRIQIRRIGWPISGRLNSGVSLCNNVPVSRAPCDFHIGIKAWFYWRQRYVTRKRMYVTRNVVNLPIWLVLSCKVAYQKWWRSMHICKSYYEKKTSDTVPTLC